MPTINIDWTLSAANVLTYLGVLLLVAWRLGNKLSEVDNKLSNHSDRLNAHAELIANQDARFDTAMGRVGQLAENMQNLIGRCEFLFTFVRKDPRD